MTTIIYNKSNGESSAILRKMLNERKWRPDSARSYLDDLKLSTYLDYTNTLKNMSSSSSLLCIFTHTHTQFIHCY